MSTSVVIHPHVVLEYRITPATTACHSDKGHGCQQKKGATTDTEVASRAELGASSDRKLGGPPASCLEGCRLSLSSCSHGHHWPSLQQGKPVDPVPAKFAVLMRPSVGERREDRCRSTRYAAWSHSLEALASLEAQEAIGQLLS